MRENALCLCHGFVVYDWLTVVTPDPIRWRELVVLTHSDPSHKESTLKWQTFKLAYSKVYWFNQFILFTWHTPWCSPPCPASSHGVPSWIRTSYWVENGNDDEPLLHVRAGHHTFSPGDECQNFAHALLSSVHLLPIRGGKGGDLRGRNHEQDCSCWDADNYASLRIFSMIK